MKRSIALFALALFPVLASCEPAKEAKEAEKPATPAATSTKVLLKTNKGDITLELDAAKAPVTVKNFLEYVNKKHYDGTVFHRVIQDFMIQGGDPESRNAKPDAALGGGGPGYQIPAVKCRRENEKRNEIN